MATKIPLWHYEITLTDGQLRECDAIGYREHEEFLVWDDVRASVMQLRRDKVDEVKRSPEPVGAQDVDELEDRKPVGH
jgi:hypothetical protein